MPLLSRFGAQPIIADDPIPYYVQAAEATITLIESADQEDQAVKSVVLQALHYFDCDTQQLKRLLTRMLAMRDQWLHHAQQRVTPAQLAETLRDVMEDELAEILDTFNFPLQSVLMPLAQFAAANVGPDHAIYPLLDWHAPLTNQVEDLPSGVRWRICC